MNYFPCNAITFKCFRFDFFYRYEVKNNKIVSCY